MGWWWSQRRRAQPTPVTPTPVEHMSPPEIVLPPEAFEDVIVEEHQVDDLTTIKGIGNKMSEALASIGIHRFTDLANADPEDIKARLGNRPVSVSAIEEWIIAAKEYVTNQ